MNIKSDIIFRVRLAFLVVLLFSGLIVFNLFKVQFIEGKQWRVIGLENSVEIRDVKATRGNIFSEDGSLLATSVPTYRLALDPFLPSEDLLYKNIDSLSFLLSRLIPSKSPTQIKNEIVTTRKKGRQHMYLTKKKINYQQKKEIEKWPLLRLGRYTGGIIFEKLERRVLPFSNLGLRTIGKINSEGKGTSGVEFSFNRELAGKNGTAVYKRMAGGWRPVADINEESPIDGYDIQTTLNLDIQDVTESALLQQLKRHQADYGVAIVMEVKTGAIKAMSNLEKGDVGYEETYNYGVGNHGVREPGSTFKLASMIALLEEEGSIALDDTIDTGNGIANFYGLEMKDHRVGGYGKITVKEVFEYSSNIGIAKLISQYFGDQPEKFINYLAQFNLNRPLEFQLFGEGKPYIKDPSDSTWSKVTLPWMSHGYELKVSPLQMLTLYNAIANNGVMIRPIIVKKILAGNNLIEEFDTEVINRKICSKSTLSKIKLMMEGVVERGTAKNINDGPYRIAGKTGTAKQVENGVYVNKYYTSFVGYFPAENPKYTCVIVIDNPKGSKYYGSDVSAPVFKEIADKIYSLELELHEIKPMKRKSMAGVFPYIKSGNYNDLSYICNELGISNHKEDPDQSAVWVKTKTIGNSVFWKDNVLASQVVPDVRGMTLKDALYILENKGFKVSFKGRGRVSNQSITPGQHFAKGITMILNLG